MKPRKEEEGISFFTFKGGNTHYLKKVDSVKFGKLTLSMRAKVNLLIHPIVILYFIIVIIII